MKICSNKKCIFAGQLQLLENFVKDKNRKDGKDPWCKKCKKQYRKENREKIALKEKQYNLLHVEEKSEYNKRYNILYNEERKKYKRQYHQEHKKEEKEYNKQYSKKRRKEDINYKVECSLRTRLNSAIKNNLKSGSAVADLMMSIADFKIYLEERFYPNPETGEMMSWENWAINGWHIDHIIPLSAFDLTDREQLLKAVHYSNLRPMWSKQNLSENDRGMSRRKNK